MTSGEHLQGKFQAWAARIGLPLQGSKGKRGKPNYTLTLDQNFFGGTLLESARSAFRAGAGGEIRGAIPKMSALHSSSAIAVNLFQHWVANGQLSVLANLLKIPSRGIETGEFEDRFPVCSEPKVYGFNEPPHLDFALRYKDRSRVGVECKLFEPYGRLDHHKLRPAYLKLRDAWDDIPGCHAMAVQLAEGDADFRRIGASQLLKHILGLKFQTSADKVRLIYLYCDATGDEAYEHRREISLFQSQIADDPIRFIPMTVQEFILRAMRSVRQDHPDYVNYLTERYL